MGTPQGAKKWIAPVVLVPSLVFGGGSYYVKQVGETCAVIEQNVAALSEPGFAMALKLKHGEVRGVIGIHYPTHPETGESVNKMWSKLVVLIGRRAYGDLFESSDLEGTTGEKFFVRSPNPEFDHRLLHWHELRDAGYEITSVSTAFAACEGSVEQDQPT